MGRVGLSRSEEHGNGHAWLHFKNTDLLAQKVLQAAAYTRIFNVPQGPRPFKQRSDKSATETDRIKSSHESTGGGFLPEVIPTRPMAGCKQINLSNGSCKAVVSSRSAVVTLRKERGHS